MDSLLTAFESFEMTNSEKSRIYGGVQQVQVLGCAQSGGNSYVDWIGQDGSLHCDLLINTQDSSDWIDTMCPRLLTAN